MDFGRIIVKKSVKNDLCQISTELYEKCGKYHKCEKSENE